MFSIRSSAPALPSLSKPGGWEMNSSIVGFNRATIGLLCSAIRLASSTPPFSIRRSASSSTRCAVRSFARWTGTISSSSSSVLVSIRLSACTARRWPDVCTPACESPAAPFCVTIEAHTASAPSATTASDMPATAIRAKSFEGEAGYREGFMQPSSTRPRGS
jgi:hypothetical protein